MTLRKSMKERAARWFRKDATLNLFSNKIDKQFLDKMYRFMCSFDEMPIQIWRENIVSEDSIIQSIVKVRVWTVGEAPIKSVSIHTEDTEIYCVNFAAPNTFSHTGEIEFNEEVPVYVEVSYFGIGVTKKVGFPVSYEAEDPTYQPNPYLDRNAVGMGLTRREYRDDLTSGDLQTTYPVGYLYPVEQDYYLEERLLNEYRTRMGTTTEVDLGVLSVKIKPEILVAKTLQLSFYKESDQMYSLVVIEDGNIIEKFTGNVSTIVASINESSHLIEANSVNGGSYSEPLFGEIKQSGLFDRFKLLRSEIYHKLGVIPIIKNIDEYLFIWKEEEIKTGGVWAGDEYWPGVFYVDIPYHSIPSNFKILPMKNQIDEDGSVIQGLQNICDTCKPFGTKAIPQYVVHGEPATLEFEDPVWDIPISKAGTELDLELDIEDTVGTVLNENGDEVTFIDEEVEMEMEMGAQINSSIYNTLGEEEVVESAGMGFGIATAIEEHSFHNASMEMGIDYQAKIISTVFVHDTSSDYMRDSLAYYLAESGGIVSIDQVLKSNGRNPSLVDQSGAGYSWSNIQNMVDADANTYAQSSPGTGSQSKNPTVSSQVGNTCQWENLSNAADTNSDTYAYTGELPTGTLVSNPTGSSQDTGKITFYDRPNIADGDSNTFCYSEDPVVEGSQGAKYSSNQTTVDDGNPTGGGDWLYGSRVESCDGSGAYASATTTYRQTNVLRVTGFGFTIPSNATITGVKVLVKRKTSTTASTRDNKIYLVRSGSRTGSNKADLDEELPNTYATKSYGGNGVMWGTSLTPAQVNASNFGVDVSYYNASSYNPTFYIDCISMYVYYTTGSGLTETNTITLTGVSFNHPDAVIKGLKVEVRSYCETASKTLDVWVTSGATTKLKTASLPTSVSYLAFGGDNDMWGGLPESLTSLTIKLQANTNARVQLYHVKVTAYWERRPIESNKMVLTGSTFSIPANSVVTGVKVNVRCWCAASGKTLTVRVKSGSGSWAKTTTLPVSGETLTIPLGGDGDMWGGIPTTFTSLDIELQTNTASQSRIYYVTVTVYTASTLTWTQSANAGLTFTLSTACQVMGIKATVKCYSAAASKTLEVTLVAGGTTSQVKTIGLPTSVGTVELGADNDLWNLPNTPATYNTVTAKLRTNAAGIDTRIYSLTLTIYYKFKAGALISERIKADITNGQWKSLSVSRTLNNQTMTYSIYKSVANQIQSVSNTVSAFGSSASNQLMVQSFVPTQSTLSSVAIKAGGKVGSPTDDIYVSIYNDNEGKPGSELKRFIVPASRWIDSEVIDCTTYVTGLTVGQQYWIVVRRSGTVNSSNYYQIRANTTNVYANGSWKKGDGTNYSDMGGDLYFVTFYPVTLLSGQTGTEVNLEGIEYADLQIRIDFISNSVSATPTLDKFELKAQEVREG